MDISVYELNIPVMVCVIMCYDNILNLHVVVLEEVFDFLGRPKSTFFATGTSQVDDRNVAIS